MSTNRLKCCAPLCRRTRKVYFADDCAEDEEWLCGPHYRTAPADLRTEYDAAWKAATAADKKGNACPKIYQRVTVAWEKVKEAAMRKALAN